MAKFLMALGALLLLGGLLLHFFPNALNWFGRLPGDVRIQRENGVFYFPVTSMIIVSVVLSALGLLFRR